MDRRHALVGLAVVLAVAPALWGEGTLSGDAYRDNDWLNTRLFDLLALQGWRTEGLPPLWTPLLGGGFPLAVHPSDSSLSPSLLPTLLLGEAWGLRVTLLALLGAGAAGVAGLGRQIGGLSPRAAALGAAAFAASGWLPGMLLIGFWQQAFQLLALPATWLLLRGRRGDGWWAAALFALLLQQGGHAAAAAAFFAAMALGSRAAATAGVRGPAAVAAFGLLASAAFARHHLGAAVACAAVGAAALAVVARRRPPLPPVLVRAGAVAAGVVALAAVRLAGLAWAAGSHTYDDGPWQPGGWWFGDPWVPGGAHPGDFYRSVAELGAGLLRGAPLEVVYAVERGAPGAPLGLEAGWLGLGVVVLVLAGAGAVAAGRARPRWRPLLLWAAAYAALCLGPTLPPDLHFLWLRGLPDLGSLAQPLKYHCLFLAVPLCLLAGAAADGALSRTRLPAGAALALGGGLLVLPTAASNAPVWAARFAEPVAAVEPVGGLLQVALVGPAAADATSWATARALTHDDDVGYRRPSEAQEYDNVRRGVATIGWYASFGLPSVVEPARFVDARGAMRSNPAFPGFAVGTGEPTVAAGVGWVEVASAGGPVVLNLDARPGLRSSCGPVIDEAGRVGLDVPASGRCRLRWAPGWLLAALAVQALAWLGLGLGLWRRR